MFYNHEPKICELWLYWTGNQKRIQSKSFKIKFRQNLLFLQKFTKSKKGGRFRAVKCMRFAGKRKKITSL